jgi:D-alanine-D-alanine ligase
MKIAIIYNRDSANVINLFGLPNREKIGLKTVKRISDSLKKGKHLVRAFEGDKDLIDKLEDFMPRVLKGERPGMAFNLSYGIQGQARYTHVPGILEMVGIPYIGSGPLAHSLALDKVVAKIIFRQNGLPTPDFAVLDMPGFDMADMKFPLIVKPKNEAVSFGLKIVNNEKELREGADVIFEKFSQPVLAEQYIAGREINVGLLGNNPPETLPPVELVFGGDGPPVYTYEDKTRRSGREIEFLCPAPIDKKLADHAQDLARRAFNTLGCYDCARVDMRLDNQGNLYILEVNSLPSMGEHGSYTLAAESAGLDFTALVNRLVDVASARYFGTPSPPQIEIKKNKVSPTVFTYIVERRDRIEKRLEEWVRHPSRTHDTHGIQDAFEKLENLCDELGLRKVGEFTDGRTIGTWETRRGFEKGTLLIGNLDVPLESNVAPQNFRRDPEWLYGEGIGVSRAPLIMLEFSLKALRSFRLLRKIPLGILYYADEGRDCRYSKDIIKQAAAKAGKVLVLRPGNLENKVITQRRGLRKYRLIVEGIPRRLGKTYRKPEVLRWVSNKLREIPRLSSPEKWLDVAAGELRTESFPHLLPHRVICILLVSYLDARAADRIEKGLRDLFNEKGYKIGIEMISDRSPMKKRKANERLLRSLQKAAEVWEIPISHESSLYPSVAGLVPSSANVVCGIGPVACDITTPKEAVQRISMLQRTLLLAQYLVDRLDD